MAFRISYSLTVTGAVEVSHLFPYYSLIENLICIYLVLNPDCVEFDFILTDENNYRNTYF